MIHYSLDMLGDCVLSWILLSLSVLVIMGVFSQLMHMIFMNALFECAKRERRTSWTSHHQFLSQLLNEIFKAHSLNLLGSQSLNNFGHIGGSCATDATALTIPANSLQFAV